MSPAPSGVRFISIERRMRNSSPASASSAFARVISRSCSASSSSSSPPAIFSPFEWSVIATYA
ncbi:MAG: hypothetical protein ABR599_10550 [Gemmatimonadota bacterium]